MESLERLVYFIFRIISICVAVYIALFVVSVVLTLLFPLAVLSVYLGGLLFLAFIIGFGIYQLWRFAMSNS